jgi:integrase/recombinase XerD
MPRTRTELSLERSPNWEQAQRLCGLSAGAVYSEVVKRYMAEVGIAGENMGPHALRATAATSALEHDADISQVQAWLGHSNISTTKVYDRRDAKPQQSPTFKVAY